LTGFIREEGAKENIRVELGRLTGSWRNLQNEEIRDLYRCPQIILFMKMLKECYVRVVCSDLRKGRLHTAIWRGKLWKGYHW